VFEWLTCNICNSESIHLLQHSDISRCHMAKLAVLYRNSSFCLPKLGVKNFSAKFIIVFSEF